MHLKVRNVNDAFAAVVRAVNLGAMGNQSGFDVLPVSRRPSRNGPVIQVTEPVLLTYERPRERVLFNESRDCNIFFHLYESLWMLAGREDVRALEYYLPRMREYSDDGKVFNGAYGNRWRNWKVPTFSKLMVHPDFAWEAIDQLKTVAKRLKANPDDRRGVVTMWSVHSDLMRHGSKDVCCNLNVLFSVREVLVPKKKLHGIGPQALFRFLDMTVTNRSNDLVWGMLGANAVHFSFLHEYMAARVGAEVGVYNHFTNNLHAYESNWNPEAWLKEYRPRMLCGICLDKHNVGAYVAHGVCDQCGRDSKFLVESAPLRNPYESGLVTPLPLVAIPARFDVEVAEFVERHSRDAMAGHYEEPFLRDTAQPMCVAFHHWKRGARTEALAAADRIASLDWRKAALGWMRRRIERTKAKEATDGGER
jgi:thymidylate synthase